MKKTWIVILLAIFAAAPALAAADRPNIVFVLFDDIGYGQPQSYRGDSSFKIDRKSTRLNSSH